MKKWIISPIAAVVCLCLLVRFGGVLEHANRAGIGGPKSGITNASSSGKLHYLREEWMGDVRSAAAALRYLLEPEPPALSNALIASNGAGKNLVGPGLSLIRIPRSAQSNRRAPLEGLAATLFARDDLFTNQSLVASMDTVPPGTIFSPSLFHNTISLHFPESQVAGHSADGRGYVVERWPGLNGLWSSNIIELLNTVATNSEHAPMVPVKNYKPGLADSAERPA